MPVSLWVAYSLQRRLFTALLVAFLSLDFHPLYLLGSVLLKILFIAVLSEYFISCMRQALQVCSFSPSTPSLVLDIDDHFEAIGVVLSGYKGCVMILRDSFYRASFKNV